MTTFQEHLAHMLATDPEFKRLWDEEEPARVLQRACVRGRIFVLALLKASR